MGSWDGGWMGGRLMSRCLRGGCLPIVGGDIGAWVRVALYPDPAGDLFFPAALPPVTVLRYVAVGFSSFQSSTSTS